MKIFLLGRHATTGDSEKVTDLPLSEKGEKEAQDMAQRVRSVVRNIPLTIWSSTAQRARETALIVKAELEKRGIVVTIEFFAELWSDNTHSYQEKWLEKKVSSFEGEALLIIAHAEISEYAVSLGCEYILLPTDGCMMIRGDWAIEI